MTCTVAVTGPDEGGWPAWICTRRALHRAGVQACRITPSNPRPPQPIHGLILGGGADILDASGAGPTPTGIDVADRRWVDTFWSALLAPPLALFRLVGSRLSPSPTEPDANRDALEFDLLMRAEAAGIPVLGICRGAQLMNLARGGSLLFDVQQMYSERPRLRTVFPRRRVFVEPTSRLGYFLGEHEIAVNSLHQHAAGEVPDSLRVVAREPAGVVQAIEDPYAPFFIGVQWHPEYLPQLPAQRRVFLALAEEARRAAGSGLSIQCPGEGASEGPKRMHGDLPTSVAAQL